MISKIVKLPALGRIKKCRKYIEISHRVFLNFTCALLGYICLVDKLHPRVCHPWKPRTLIRAEDKAEYTK